MWLWGLVFVWGMPYSLGWDELMVVVVVVEGEKVRVRGVWWVEEEEEEKGG